MLVDKATPVQQLDGSLEAEDRGLHQHLLLPLRHVTLLLCRLGALRVLSPCKELHPFLQNRPEQVSSTGCCCQKMKCVIQCVKGYMAEQESAGQRTKNEVCKEIQAVVCTKKRLICLRQEAVSRSYKCYCACEQVICADVRVS